MNTTTEYSTNARVRSYRPNGRQSFKPSRTRRSTRLPGNRSVIDAKKTISPIAEFMVALSPEAQLFNPATLEALQSLTFEQGNEG